MDWKQHISENPKILCGKPVITGTRISVELITGKLAAGDSFEDILTAYPHLTREQLQAALAYVTELLKLPDSPSADREA